MTPNNQDLISAVKTRNHMAIQTLLDKQANVNQTDDYGWTPLCWAAAQGSTDLTIQLLDRFADPFQSGEDQRTPYLIALAAGHIDVARLLQKAEEQRGGDQEQRSSRHSELRPYCRAYHLGELSQFPGWQAGFEKEPVSASFEPLTDDSILFLHRDLTVTRSAWRGEQIVYSTLTEQWKSFCDNFLNFHPLSDFECIPPSAVNVEAT